MYGLTDFKHRLDLNRLVVLASLPWCLYCNAWFDLLSVSCYQIWVYISYLLSFRVTELFM